jgi:hypothetical protein
VLETVVLASIGAVVSYGVSLAKALHQWWRKE